LEHRIEVLTDHPILDQLPQHTWDDMVDVIRNGFQKGNPVKSLCYAIKTSGAVLAVAFTAENGEANPNELSNELIQDT
jgi:uncharacterized membrane protein